MQLILFCPIEAVNFPTFELWSEPHLILLPISFVRRTPLAAHVDTAPSTGSYSSLPIVSCFLTSTVSCFLTLPLLTLTYGPDLEVWPDQGVSAEFFRTTSLLKGWRGNIVD